MIIFILVNIAFLIVNLITVGLNLKLYTEYFKDRKISDRTKKE